MACRKKSKPFLAMHPGDVPTGTFKSILKQAVISENDFRGLRITVGDVLGWLASGMSNKDILTDFPDLREEDIRACLAFVADKENHNFLMA